MLFCFGFGYVAQHLANIYVGKTSGTNSSGSGNIIFNQSSDFDPGILQDVSYVLVSIPPTSSGDLVYDKLQNDLAKLPKLKWLGYLSATSVYGDAEGGLVDENFPLVNSGRGLDRIAAEKLWLGSNLPVHIFRLSAIYGKGRSVIDQILSGTARRIYKENQIFSRMHVEDIAATLLASINKTNPGSIYNLADDFPSSQIEVVEYACSLLNMDPPRMENFANADLSPMLKGFYSSSRRIVNTKIKQELGVKLQFPSYKEGLKNIITAKT